MKFQHLQKVEIISGFYEGLFGIITNSRNNGEEKYYIEINIVGIGQSWIQPKTWVNEKNLRSIN